MDKQTVTLIGSYRKERSQFEKIYYELSETFTIICPKGIDFVDHNASFVKLPHEVGQSIKTIEEGVLDAIRQSDFVWLFAPSGYVGVSASFEMGFAHSLGIPLFTDSELEDEMLATMITKRIVGKPRTGLITEMLKL